MEKLINNIISYLTYLNKDCNLQTSVHFNNDRLRNLPTKYILQLHEFNAHVNPYCILIKSQKYNYHKCIEEQHQIINSKQFEPFLHTCYAGVYEYIAPFVEDNHIIGYIAVSGFRKNNTPNILNIDSWNINLINKEIPLNLCNTLIPPLCLMFEKLFSLCQKNEVNEYNNLLQYLNECHNNINLEDICLHFNCSKSHISHMFKKNNGMTINAYCNKLKLEDAKKLLKYTNYSIMKISYEVGFNDVSYFIKLFKQEYQQSPLQYKKSDN